MMGVRDRLDRIAAWFGFGVDDEDYYEDEVEEERRYAGEAYASGARRGAEPGPTVRRLGRAERSSAFGTSLGDLFGSEASGRGERYGGQNPPARLRPVILNLQSVDSDLSRRMVDFCSGLTYALDGNIQSVANRVFLLTPRDVEVSAEERKRIAERAFFNQL